MKLVRVLPIAMLLLATAPAAQSEVTSLGTNGFVVQYSTRVTTPPEESYRVMVEDIARWWSSEHTWSADAANLYIEKHPGGCFCERLPDGGSVEHLRIVHWAPGKLIRMQGGLGPLQEMGMQGVMSWKTSSSEEGSIIEWRYSVHGFLDGGFEAIATAVDGVLAEQISQLVALLDQG